MVILRYGFNIVKSKCNELYYTQTKGAGNIEKYREGTTYLGNNTTLIRCYTY
jgi:hypothetical protein